MHLTNLHYLPVTLPFFMLLMGVFAVMLALIEIGILHYAYARIGIGSRYVLAVLLLSLLGSYINIPVAQLPAERTLLGQAVDFYGIQYIIPVVRDWPGTVIAVNVGGAVIPVVLSLYLMVKGRLYGEGLLGIVVVTAFVYLMAYPVRGLGIAEPIFIPPLITAIVALILSRRHAAPLAYISGSLGTLIGADLLNLDKVRGLGAPVASIGGAGTFDGIFMTGLLAVLLASIAVPGQAGQHHGMGYGDKAP